VEVLVTRTRDVTVAAILEVLLENGDDFILAETVPNPGGVPQEEGRR
jgi:hypothetical protein